MANGLDKKDRYVGGFGWSEAKKKYAYDLED